MTDEKPAWEEYALIVSVIGLIVTSSLTGALAFYSFKLTEQANSIAQRSLDLQSYTPIIVPKTETNQIYLNYEGYSPVGTNHTEIISSGLFNFSLTVFTPNDGLVEVRIENFTEFEYLSDSDTLNSTFLGTNSTYDQFVNSGVSSKDFSMFLKAGIYFNNEALQQQTAFEIDNYIPVGVVYLKAIFTDVLNSTVTKEFSELVMTSIQNNGL
jgi:hypothetical protein